MAKILTITLLLVSTHLLAEVCDSPHFNKEGVAKLLLPKDHKIEFNQIIEPEVFKCDRNGIFNKQGDHLCLQSLFCPDPATAFCSASRMQGGMFILDKNNGGLIDIKEVDLNPKTRPKGSMTNALEVQLRKQYCHEKASGIRGFSDSYNFKTEEGNRFQCLCRPTSCKQPVISGLYSKELIPKDKNTVVSHYNCQEIIKKSKFKDCRGSECPVSCAPDGSKPAFYVPITSLQKNKMINYMNNHLIPEEIIEERTAYNDSYTAHFKRLFRQTVKDKVSLVRTGRFKISRSKETSVERTDAHLGPTIDKVANIISHFRNTYNCFPNKRNPTNPINENEQSVQQPALKQNTLGN